MAGQEIILIVIVIAFAAFMFYSSRKRRKQQADLATKMVPGARVMLSFGVYGTLLSVDDDAVTAEVEVAPGTVLTVHRQTLSRVVDDTPTAVDTTTAAEPDVLTEDPKRVTELNGEPVYGERVDDPTKRKTED